MWMKPAGGAADSLTGDQGSYTGYVKVREKADRESTQQNADFAEAAQECKGIKDRAERNQCMRDNL